MKKVGRPTKYKAEMCERAIELMREGYSLAMVAREFDIARKNMNEWRDRYPDFRDAIKKGLDLSQGYWEKLGLDHVVGQVDIEGNPIQFNHVLWFMQMKNRFKHDWRDKHEVAHTGADGGPIAIQAFPKCKTPEEFIEWQKQQDPPKLKLIK